MSKFNIRSKVGKAINAIEKDVGSSVWGSITFGYAVGLVAVAAATVAANKLND